MPLTSGSRLGAYEILSPLGAGGMGEVYKARDTRLDRTAAIKVLPETLAVDPQFRERFNREAKTISQLDHPSICALYDIGDQDGTAFLVMQYLEGETLAERLKRGALPLDDALEIATQIAAALGAAHRRGIVHRDLKPGNVMLTKTGTKLLDFGLAKDTSPVTVSAELSILPTTPPQLTAQGAIVGTFQYMSPEQVEGCEADARSDLFSFGAVLYEMVTGQVPFPAKTQASLIAAILEHQPTPIRTMQPLAPELLDHIVSKCLTKERDNRWQNAADLLSELTWISEHRSASPTAAAKAMSRMVPRSYVPMVLAGVVCIAVGFAVATLVRGGEPTRVDIARAVIATHPAERLLALNADLTTNEGRPSRTAMTWSPDGRVIVFSGTSGGRLQLYSRALDQGEASPLAGTEGGSSPFFSPDGRWIGFSTNVALKKIQTGSGGPATTICETPGGIFGASWGVDDVIVYSRGRNGLWRVSAGGGTPALLARPDTKHGEVKYLLPQMLPGNRGVLFTITHNPLPTWTDTQIAVLTPTTGERRTLVNGGADGRYSPSGHLVYMQRGNLMAAPFDLQRLSITGGALSVIGDVMQAANTTNEDFESGAGQFAVSSSGSLLYLTGGISPDAERSLTWVDRAGAAQPLPVATRAYMSPRLSPDATHVAVWTQGDRAIWQYDLDRGALTRFPAEGRNARPVWTPEGNRIAFVSAVAGDENGFWKAADGSGSAERLSACECVSVPAAWSPDGRVIAIVEASGGSAGTNAVIKLLSMADRSVRVLIQDEFSNAYPDISPNGHWIAYASNESGREEVYAQPFPGGGARHQISTDGGSAPAWSRDGRELFYITALSVGGQAAQLRMMSVAVTPGSTLTAGVPRVLFEGKYGATALIRGYDVSPDGRRFLMVQQRERPMTVAAQMMLVLNWFNELNARVPTK